MIRFKLRAYGSSSYSILYRWEFLVALPFDLKLLRNGRATHFAPMVSTSSYYIIDICKHPDAHDFYRCMCHVAS